MMNSSDQFLNTTSFIIKENFTWMFCHFVDFPPNGIDCSRSDPQVCVKCPVQGRYLSGDSSVGLSLLYCLWVILVMASFISIIHNVLVIMVVRRRETFPSFDFLLTFLACVDIVVSLTALSGGMAEISYFGNWSSDKFSIMDWCYISLYTFCAARSASSFSTIAICLKHLLMISYPIKAPEWFTLNKTRAYALVTILIAITLGVPRFLSYSLVVNIYADVPSLEGLKYIATTTATGKFVYQKLLGFHNQIDYWFPPPTILIIVLLSYWRANKLSKQRQKLTTGERNNISAGRMFLPVAIFCVLTNLLPMTIIFCSVFAKRTYRELYLTLYASSAINSAVNFPIYYYRSKPFQQSTQKVIQELMKRCGLSSGDEDARANALWIRKMDENSSSTGVTN